MSSEALMVSPVPRSAFGAQSTLWAAPHTSNQNANFGKYGETSSCHDDDDATRDLHQALSGRCGEAVQRQVFRQASSNATTDWSPTPDLTSSSSPAHRASDHFAPPPRSLPEQEEQMRKVFVGGVPQRIDQVEFFEMFARIGNVRKAWLQMVHDTGCTKQPTSGRRHRGFGFVVFKDKGTINQLLGENSSSFITFGDGLRLEVKRACSNKSTGQQQIQSPSPNLQIHSPSQQNSPKFSAHLLNVLPPPTRNSSSALNSLEGGSSPQLQLAHPTPQRQQMSFHSRHPTLYDILFEYFAIRMPRNKQELEWVLVCATPDHYDD